MSLVLEKSLILSFFLSLYACANQNITEIGIKPDFIQESSAAKEFKPISVYQFNNIEQNEQQRDISQILGIDTFA